MRATQYIGRDGHPCFTFGIPERDAPHSVRSVNVRGEHGSLAYLVSPVRRVSDLVSRETSEYHDHHRATRLRLGLPVVPSERPFERGTVVRVLREYINNPHTLRYMSRDAAHAVSDAQHYSRVVRSLVQASPHDNRPVAPSAPSSVRATTVQASARARVRDSHDARPAKARRSARPYSRRTFLRDVEAPRGYAGEYDRVVVDPALLALVGADAAMQGARMAGTVVHVVPPLPERSYKSQPKSPDRRAVAAAKTRAIAAATSYSHDFTTS